MKRLTPAAVTLMTVVMIGLLVTAYFAKMLVAEEPKARLLETPKAAAVEYREIPLALSPLEPGTQLSAAHVGTGRVPVGALEPETLLTEKGLIGRIAKEPIAAGRPIRSSQLYPPGQRPPLAVEPGMRAVSVSLSRRESSVVGLLRKGQYVDVYLTPRLEDHQTSRLRNGVTITLLTGIRVLAVGGNPESESGNPELADSVTLELTPEQANILILAHEKGEIALSYNPDGKKIAGGVSVSSQDRATMDEILGLNRSEPVTPVTPLPAKPFTSETFKGAKRSTLRFDPAVSTDSGNQI